MHILRHEFNIIIALKGNVYMNFTYETKHLILKVLDESYTETVLSFLKDNRQYFEPFEVKKSTKYYSYEYQSENLNLEYRAFLDMKYLRYYVFLKEDRKSTRLNSSHL